MVNETYFTVWHIVYATVMIPTVFGNGLILYSVAKFPRLRSNIHILIANLAFSDLIVGAVLIPTDMLSDIFGWKSKKYVCLACLGFFVLSLGSSCFSLLLVSVERYIVICFPFRARTLLTKPKMVFMISFGWVLVAVNSTLPFYGVNTFTNSSAECVRNVVWPEAYQLYCDWILICGLIVTFTFYMIVVRIALKKARMRNSIGGKTEYNVHTKAQTDLHHVITMVIVLGTFVICWLPYVILSFIVTFWDTPTFQFVKRCTLIPGLFNSAINWLIYGYRNNELRKAFRTILKCKFCNKDSNRPTSNAAAIYTSGNSVF
ncbi:trace amine-associated receptor 13c-like [Mercenaria mercenaria]|uniref:trace amine-associated receptor 13c-like n=1 Tax=Mercenaria mercenaria TaxID=6596 RepID=UPI00234EC740|nr:trace amine-associated receptor 13c-like [Mercenaria mercenaria]